jgi:uncharacterized repeat protein (TIGR03803 family)
MYRFVFASIAVLAASGAASAQTFTTLHNFGGGNGNPGGLWNDASISQGRDGGLFSTSPGSQTGLSAAFRVGPTGSFNVLHVWTSGASEPLSGLVLARDGKYYGITRFGGPDKLGMVFRISGTGGGIMVHGFTGGNAGAHPWSVLQSLKGDFYVSTEGASAAEGDEFGSIFEMTSDGNLTLLHAFNGSDGASPLILTQSSTDFRFYGVTTGGGTNNIGTIFRVSWRGEFEVLHNFDNATGGWPNGALIQANDGNFYGTTSEGGPSGSGVLFRITPSGQYTVLHYFGGDTNIGGPVGRLVQASDGNLYGTATGGGDTGFGVIYRATLAGDVVALHSFSLTEGYNANSQLMQHTNGKLYGGTAGGGTFNQGIFYSFDLGLPPFVSYLPTYGRAATVVQILGQGFNDTSQVSFNGAPGTVTYVSPTFIEARVPAGATTGPITVVTGSTTLTSNKVFIVH